MKTSVGTTRSAIIGFGAGLGVAFAGMNLPKLLDKPIVKPLDPTQTRQEIAREGLLSLLLGNKDSLSHSQGDVSVSLSRKPDGCFHLCYDEIIPNFHKDRSQHLETNIFYSSIGRITQYTQREWSVSNQGRGVLGMTSSDIERTSLEEILNIELKGLKVLSLNARH